MTLYSFKELHFPIEEPELMFMVDTVWTTAKGSRAEKGEYAAGNASILK